MVENNSRECQDCQQNLIALIDGDLNIQTSRKTEKHLHECEACHALYAYLADLPPWENVTALEIPAQVRANIETAVEKALNGQRTEQPATKEKAKRRVRKFFPEFILVFQPVPPAPVFRGEKPVELQVIEHRGRDLLLTTGLTNKVVKLTSIFEEFTRQGKTDEQGKVIFKDLKQGDYLAEVEGYRLAAIKVSKKKSVIPPK